MKNDKAFLKLMTPEAVALWGLSKEKELANSELRRYVQRAVQGARHQLRAFGTDMLAFRLETYGNGGGWGSNQIKQLSQVVFDDKNPNLENLGQWVSVEIELIMPDKAADNAFVSFVRHSGYSKLITLKDDGSIKVKEEDDCDCESYEDDDGDMQTDHTIKCSYTKAFGREIVVTFQYGQWDLVKTICDKLNSLKCTVNKTCGLHVHFDMRQMGDNTRGVMTIAQRIAKCVPALKQMLPESRQNNDFCKKVINKMTDGGSDARELNRNRYSFVNVLAFRRHKTLEIRGHSGTTDAVKIINWIRILKTIMGKPNRTVLNTIQVMIQKIEFDNDLSAYMLARQAKFSKGDYLSDDVSSDNQIALVGQSESFSIGPAGNQVELTQTQGNRFGYDYTVMFSGQMVTVSDLQLFSALNVQSAEPLLTRLVGTPANQNTEVA